MGWKIRQVVAVVAVIEKIPQRRWLYPIDFPSPYSFVWEFGRLEAESADGEMGAWRSGQEDGIDSESWLKTLLTVSQSKTSQIDACLAQLSSAKLS